MKLWLDDERVMPSTYDIHVKTAHSAMAVISVMGEFIDEVSLDHDLGDLNGDCGDGYDVACFIEAGAQRGALSQFKWNVHSANPTGAEKMKVALRRADAYWSGKSGSFGNLDRLPNGVSYDPTEFEG